MPLLSRCFFNAASPLHERRWHVLPEVADNLFLTMSHLQTIINSYYAVALLLALTRNPSAYAGADQIRLTTEITEATETFSEPGPVRDQQPGYGWL
jgi:hypothetical protein